MKMATKIRLSTFKKEAFGIFLLNAGIITRYKELLLGKITANLFHCYKFDLINSCSHTVHYIIKAMQSIASNLLDFIV